MNRWCKQCQGVYPERDGGVVYAKDGASLYWVCQACTRRAKVSGDGRVRALEEFLDEGGSEAVDAALNAVSRTAKTKAS